MKSTSINYRSVVFNDRTIFTIFEFSATFARYSIEINRSMDNAWIDRTKGSLEMINGALIISTIMPCRVRNMLELQFPPLGSRGWCVYTGRIGPGRGNFRARRFRPYLIPARQEIANKILASAREINPSHATVEASLRIIARRPA